MAVHPCRHAAVLGGGPDQGWLFRHADDRAGADAAPYHDRQIVLLRPEEGAAWLKLDQPEADLLRAMPAGSLDVEKIFPVAA